MLFGDGAGACLVSARHGASRAIADSMLASDGDFAGVAAAATSMRRCTWTGARIILQATRKLPRVISDLLERNRVQGRRRRGFLMHQANLNLITRVAQAVGAPAERFFSNIAAVREHLVGIAADRGGGMAAGRRAGRRRPHRAGGIRSRLKLGRNSTYSRKKLTGGRFYKMFTD